ncbi:MAG: PQQ-binding-like beta-propeller repeat protein [Candidatus Poseidoniaceae archaeon]|jgi:hypothetical protein|nr:PQQ-binding-like beta-propeller repeat protein [Candidatus Poseidoniaceae archaeon]
MRTQYLLAVLAAMIFLLPVNFTHASETPVEEPPNAFDLDGTTPPQATWSKNLDSGYISSAPLLWGGMAIVKTPNALNAYLQSDGSEIWSQNTSSTIQFEMSPLLVYAPELENGELPCPDLLITGWSSGEITAHRIMDGQLHWSYNTSAPAYGIQGSIVIVSGDISHREILVPMENGLLSLDPADGSEYWNVTFPDSVRGYRHWPSYWYDDNQIWYAIGDELGRMTYWNETAPQAAKTYDFSVPSGKIRSRIHSLGGGELLIPVQSSKGSQLFHWANDEIQSNVSLTGSFGIIVQSENNIIIPTTHNTTWWQVNDKLSYIATVSQNPVVGEVTAPLTDRIALPINSAHGYIELYSLDQTSNEAISQWIWKPNASGYLTAGLGFDESGNAIAIGNDAGRIEIAINDVLRANDNYQNSTQRLAEWLSQGHDTQPQMHFESTQSELETGWIFIALGSAMTLFCGALFRIGRRPHIPLAFATTMILIGMVLLLPLVNQSVSEVLSDDGNKRDDGLWPLEWKDTQIVGFKLPDPNLPDPYKANITLVSATGEIISSKPAVNSTPVVWVGGLSGSSNAYDLTALGCQVAGLNMESHNESIGGYIDSLAGAKDGDGDRWLLYWVDGIHANLAVDAYNIDDDATLIWYYY